MRHTRTLVAATTVALALAGVSACSAAKDVGAGAAAPLVSVADAMSLTTQATQQYTSVTMKMNEQVSAQGQSVNITGNGRISWKPLGADLTMSMPQLAAATGGATGMHMMMSGTVMYMGFTGTAPAAFKGKHWLKLDISKDPALAAQYNQSNGQDPSTQVKLFTSSGDIKRVGTETVDGVSTTHYSGSVDLAKLLSTEDSQLKTLAQSYNKLGLGAMNVDLWVNAQNLPVRMEESTSPSSSVALMATVDYTGYGTTPVTVTPPAASDTLDMSSMLPTG